MGWPPDDSACLSIRSVVQSPTKCWSITAAMSQMSVLRVPFTALCCVLCIKLFQPPQNCVHTLTLFIPKAVGGQSNACHQEACCESCLRATRFIYLFIFFESGDKIQPVSLLKNHIESAAAHYINTVQPIAGLATGGRRSHNIRIWSVGKNICVCVQQSRCCVHKAWQAYVCVCFLFLNAWPLHHYLFPYLAWMTLFHSCKMACFFVFFPLTGTDWPADRLFS